MKRQILEEILRLTKLQKEALVEEDVDKFQELMEEKQVQIDKLDTLHREKPETKLQKEEELLREVVTLDQGNQKEFMRQLEEVKRKLSEMRAKKRVNRVYNNPYDVSQEEGIFFDKR